MFFYAFKSALLMDNSHYVQAPSQHSWTTRLTGNWFRVYQFPLARIPSCYTSVDGLHCTQDDSTATLKAALLMQIAPDFSIYSGIPIQNLSEETTK